MVSVKEAILAIEEKPEFRHVVSVSGGKDSAALAVYLKENYPQIPAEYVFCDTGTELPETYEYLFKLEAVLGKKVQRVNALQMIDVREKPGRNSFDWILKERYGGYLPNPRMRWCTRALKIQPFEHFIGETQAFSYIGIRADENRDGYQSKKKPPALSSKQNIIPVYPFKDDQIRFQEVQEILEDSGLGFPDYYRWRSRSGCYFCFYQQKGEWQGLQREHPELYKAAMQYEQEEGNNFTWVEGRTLEQLAMEDTEYPIQDVDEADGCAICHL